MTDERMGETLWPALERLPAGSGVLFRHHASPDRLAIGERVASLCAANGLVLSVSRDAALAKGLSTHEGGLLSEQVAADLGLPFTDPAALLA